MLSATLLVNVRQFLELGIFTFTIIIIALQIKSSKVHKLGFFPWLGYQPLFSFSLAIVL